MNSQHPDPGKGQLGGSFWYLGSFSQEPFKFADGILKVLVLGTKTLGGDHQFSSLVNTGLELEGGREIYKGWEVRRKEGGRDQGLELGGKK